MDSLARKVSFIILSGVLVSPVSYSFELLSEGAMGTVSAISVESVEDIVNIAGPTAAGLTVDDDGYELLPFQSDVVIPDANPEEVTDALNFAMTQEVETWANSLNVQGATVVDSNNIGYVDELPPSAFEESVLQVRDAEFDSIIFEPEVDEESGASFELSRVEQTIRVLEQDLDSIRYVVERKVEFVETVAPEPAEDQAPSIGSGYISNLTSISNVHIATVRD